MVYFISAKALGLIKIGYAKQCVRTRLGQLRALSPTPLMLIGQIPGDVLREHELHRTFRQFRSHGEWFFATKDLMAGIEQLMAQPDAPADSISIPLKPQVQITPAQPTAALARAMAREPMIELTIWLTEEPQYAAHLKMLSSGFKDEPVAILDAGLRRMAQSIGYKKPPILSKYFMEGKPEKSPAFIEGSRVCISCPQTLMDWIAEFSCNSMCEVSIVCRLAFSVAGEEVGVPQHKLCDTDEYYRHLCDPRN